MVYPTKRSEERMGHKKVANDLLPDIDKIEFSGELRVPNPDPDWCEIAKYLWDGVLQSPLRKYWTETDYGFAWVACDAVHHAVKSGKAMSIAAAESMMRNALFNESDRRRARIELTRKGSNTESGDPQVRQNVAEFRSRRNAG